MVLNIIKKICIKLVVLSFIFLLVMSCFKKEKIIENKKEEKTKYIKSKIFELYKENVIDEERKLQNILVEDLSREEQKDLLKKGIDPKKVIEGMKLARKGEIDSILSLSQLFYSIGDKKRVKDILEIGVIEKYPEAIYNLAVVYDEEKNEEKYNELISMLPEDYIIRDDAKKNKMREEGILLYNKGIDFLKEKNYEESIKYFEQAYKKGIRDSDTQLGYLYKEINDFDNSVEWFKKASKRGSKEGRYMTGLTYFEMDKIEEAIPYFEKSYKSGMKKLAMLIAISYEKIRDSKKALEWYKIASQNGDKEAAKIVSDIENTQKRKLENVDSIFGNLSKEYSTLDVTLESILNPKKEEIIDDRPSTSSEYKIQEIRGSNAVKKKDYNISIIEILNRDTYVIK